MGDTAYLRIFSRDVPRCMEVVRAIKGEKRRIAYIRFETEPAFQAQVDWSDFQIVNPDGTTHTVYAFVMVLGYSRAMHVEFVEKRTLEAFMDCHIHAFMKPRRMPRPVGGEECEGGGEEGVKPHPEEVASIP